MGKNLLNKFFWLAFLLFCSTVNAGSFTGSESFSGSETGYGGQRVGWGENYQDGSGSTNIRSDHETSAATGELTETQTITHTNPDGSTYTETHITHVDPFTGETSDTHTERGTPPPEIPNSEPIDKGGVETDGRANGEDVTSKYGDGGGEDAWGPSGRPTRENWFDVDGNTSGSASHDSKTGHEIPSVPARVIPLICRVNSMGMKNYNDFKFDFDPKKFPKPSDMAKLQQQLQKIFTQARKALREKKPVEMSKMKLKRVPWKIPLRISGYPTVHYQIFGDKQKRADIWVAPTIKVWKIMRAEKPNRDKHLEGLLIPWWAKGEDVMVFKNLIVLFKEPGRKTSFRVNNIRPLANYRLQKPRYPKDYKIKTYTTGEIKKLGEEGMENLRQWLQ